jgi:D-3-phosphoglycerate dehydrogenase
MKVLVVGRTVEDAAKELQGSKGLQELKKAAEVEMSAVSDEEELKEMAKDADIILSFAAISAEIINLSKRLRMIQVTSVGYERIDAAAAAANGVIICNVAEANANSVSELCFGMILDLARRLSAHDRLMRACGWARVELELQMEIRYKTLGIIGLGAIGGRMAQIAKHGFDMRILAYDPFITGDKAEQLGATLVDLPTLMRESDVVTIHAPLTKETRHLIGEKELSLMKTTAILVNAARGSIVDEKALIKVLNEKKIGGACLDVFETEPLPKESPLRQMGNVVLAPHIGSTPSAMRHMRDVAIWNVLRVVRGQKPMNIQTLGTYYNSLKWAN